MERDEGRERERDGERWRGMKEERDGGRDRKSGLHIIECH